jgi:hypothetical protein
MFYLTRQKVEGNLQVEVEVASAFNFKLGCLEDNNNNN